MMEGILPQDQLDALDGAGEPRQLLALVADAARPQRSLCAGAAAA